MRSVVGILTLIHDICNATPMSHFIQLGHSKAAFNFVIGHTDPFEMDMVLFSSRHLCKSTCSVYRRRRVKNPYGGSIDGNLDGMVIDQYVLDLSKSLYIFRLSDPPQVIRI